MDTHINPDPDRERREPVFSAALPPELRGDAGELGDREEAGGVGESSAASPAEHGESAAPAAPRRRRSRLLLGVAGVALVGVGGAAFLLSPWNHVVPVPKLASSVRGLAQQAGLTKPQVLAPSASLAPLNAPLPPPETREPYKPSGREAQVQEILGFHAPEPGAPAPKPGTPPTHPAASQAALQAPPRGYVPTEPGAVAASAAPPATPDLTASVMGTMHHAEAGSAAPSGSGGPAANSPANAAPSAPPAGPDTASTAASAATSPSPTPAVTPAVAAVPAPAAPTPQDPVSRAASLVAAPMTPAEQVDVLQTVTRLAAIVRDQKREVAELRADVVKANADSASRLEDFSRRLTLAEARKALTVAEQPAPADPIPAADIVVAPPPASVPSPKPAVTLTRLTVGTVPAAADAAPRLYRVQAASPGLAMLAEVDRGGGEGAQLQVTVGDDLPGYGRVKSVSQRGTSWVVSTEHGVIGQ